MESKQKYKQHDIFSLLLDTYVDGKNLAPVTKMAQTKKKIVDTLIPLLHGHT